MELNNHEVWSPVFVEDPAGKEYVTSFGDQGGNVRLTFEPGQILEATLMVDGHAVVRTVERDPLGWTSLSVMDADGNMTYIVDDEEDDPMMLEDKSFDEHGNILLEAMISGVSLLVHFDGEILINSAVSIETCPMGYIADSEVYDKNGKKLHMETFYHGSSVLFDHFDLAHALEGDGKVKFGYGVYVTESYKTAAHYAYNDMRPENRDFYVYTLEIPSITEDNHLFSCRPVHPSVVQRTEQALQIKIPTEATKLGKEFRKYVGNLLTGKSGTVKQLISKADLEAEKKAARFFDSIGLDYFVWPQAQTKPEGLTNRAVMNEDKIRMVSIDKVQLDEKHQLIEGSQQLIRDF